MMRDFFRNHRLALLAALAVGIIYIAPNIIFIMFLGDGYKGIPIMQTASEDEYLARIREIIDGHPALGSPIFFEYKNEAPTIPPVGEFFYAAPAMFFGVSPVNILIASRFYLPFILFLLAYFLIWKLSFAEFRAVAKVNAVAGATLVTLGYDLADYRRLFDFLFGRGNLGGDFLIWSRPVNPILGAIFLFSFLLFIWAILSDTKFYKTSIAAASFFLALMIGSYFFSWGLAVSVVGVLFLFYFFKKEYLIAARLATVLLAGAALAAPYWISVWQASFSPWFDSSVLRMGLFYTHYPLLNKILLAVLMIYAVYGWMTRVWFKEGHGQRWYWFCLALILGGFFAYNQQIITGQTVWPYHFAQYTIPFAMVALIVLFVNVIYEQNRYLWAVLVFAVVASSLLFGVYSQVKTYAQFSSRYTNLQNYVTLFDWLNAQKKDCVVLAVSDWENLSSFDNAIPAFSHCNLYDSTVVFSLMPDERILHNYFVRLFLNGITAENIYDYMANNEQEARGRLASNWKGIYNVKDFPDFKDEKLEQRLKELPKNYTRFLGRNFKSELKKYRLDYVLIQGRISEQASGFVKNLDLVYDHDGIKVYKF